MDTIEIIESYRTIAGYKIPDRLVQKNLKTGSIISRTATEKIEVNPGLVPDDFRPSLPEQKQSR